MMTDNATHKTGEAKQEVVPDAKPVTVDESVDVPDPDEDDLDDLDGVSRPLPATDNNV